jgi:hypothetical protein
MYRSGAAAALPAGRIPPATARKKIICLSPAIRATPSKLNASSKASSLPSRRVPALQGRFVRRRAPISTAEPCRQLFDARPSPRRICRSVATVVHAIDNTHSFWRRRGCMPSASRAQRWLILTSACSLTMSIIIVATSTPSSKHRRCPSQLAAYEPNARPN